MKKTILIIGILIILVLVSGCANKVTKPEHVFITNKGFSPMHQPPEYHVKFVDANGSQYKYAKTNAKAVYDQVNVSKNYTITVENGYIKTINGVQV
jgi:hypothetical protein